MARLGLEALSELGLLRAGGEHLDRDLDIEVGVVAEVDVTLAAAADPSMDLVVVDLLRDLVARRDPALFAHVCFSAIRTTCAGGAPDGRPLIVV